MLDQVREPSINRADARSTARTRTAEKSRHMGREKPNECRVRFLAERFLAEIRPSRTRARTAELWPF
jgi:hypothetical protein